MIEVGLGFVIGIVILITLAFVGAHILENSKYEAAQIKKKAEIDAENLLYMVKKEAKQKAEEDASWIVNEGKETALIIVNKAKEEAESIRCLAEGERSAIKEEIRKEHEEAEKRIESLAAKSLEKENLLINVSVEEDARKKASEEAEKIIEEAMSEAYEIRKKADSILKESESKADFLLKDAIHSADSIRNKAREEAKEVLEEAAETKATADLMFEEMEERNNREMDYVLNFLKTLKGPSLLKDDLGLEHAKFFEKMDTKSHKLFTEVELLTHWNYDGRIDFRIYHIRDLIKVALLYCDFMIDQMLENVYKNGLEISKKRIGEIVFSVEKMIPKVFQYKISNEYIERKVRQATLLYEIEEYKARKKEEQRVLREQQKEEARAQREFEREMKKAREDEVKALAALAKAKAEAEKEKEDKAKFARLQEKIAGLEEALQEAVKRGERALSMAQQTKHGTVYVISNIGSFGEGVYKIGLTRRLEPLERVHELGDASVPFPFDVHALIESDDAPALETSLHQAFADKKLNIINGRKEFFRVSLDEIKEKVKELGHETEWVDVPVAPQYRDSEYLRESNKDFNTP